MKKNIDKEIERIKDTISAEATRCRNVREERAQRLLAARAELATIEGTEAAVLEESSEAEFDALMMRKAAVKEKIRLLEAQGNFVTQPNAGQKLKDINKQIAIIDAASERQAQEELAGLLQSANAILNARQEERLRLASLTEQAGNVYNVPGAENNLMMLASQQSDCLLLYSELERTPAYKRLVGTSL